MTGDQYRWAIEQLGMTQVGSSNFLEVDDSTVRRWISGRRPVPAAVSMLLYTMLKLELTPYHVLTINEIMDKEVALETSDG